MCQNISGSITLGSQSSGADGSVSSFNLPGNFKVLFTSEGCYYPDGKTVQREGVRIDFKIYPTKKGILQGRDEQLEAAINLMKN